MKGRNLISSSYSSDLLALATYREEGRKGEVVCGGFGVKCSPEVGSERRENLGQDIYESAGERGERRWGIKIPNGLKWHL